MQACARTDKTAPLHPALPATANQRAEQSGLLNAWSGPAAAVIIPKEASLAGIYIASLPSDVSTPVATRKESAFREAL